MAHSSPSYPLTLTVTDGDLSFATDLYQLTMAAAYHAQGELPAATFELMVRRMPQHRRFMVFAGLEQVLASLTALRFDHDQIRYLKELPAFANVKPGFFEMLAEFRFGGDLWALPEGTAFFPQEPVLRVSGNLLEAQIVETLILSIINFQTTIASKAARVRIAAGPERGLAEFGSRRAHGPAAAAWVARAAYLAGFDSTSNVLAGQRLGIPVVGTMAHSFILSCADEEEAFKEYMDLFPDHAIHLVDTFDTLDGVRRAISLGRPFLGVRLDSGDLEALSKATRRLLDESGHGEAKILASGDLEERRVSSLLAAGAPIDSFGVGTELATSADA
ncbi:MAG TPA: nicotinate phosphoribosyltransferase, partial [Thermoanaerobaculia bacterium]|nr:nicotinate phosphoribosyltransferase [Thermoanaerobaculia bacterium]